MTSSRQSWLLQEFSAHSVGLSTISLGRKSGRVMATGGEDGQVNVWTVGNPSCVGKFSGHTSAVEALTFNSSEELVCAGSRSGQIRIWNITERKLTRYLSGHKTAVTCIDFLSIGEFVASGSLDHKVKMWDCRRRGCIFQYTGHQDVINALQFSPDGRWISSTSDDGVCKIWDLSTGKLLHQFKEHGAPVTCLQFHPNELLLATGGKDKTVKLYDVEQFKMISSFGPQSSTIRKVVFSESGHCVYAASQDMCHAYVWDPKPQNIDSLVVKWGKPVDVVVSAKQLISATIKQNIVSNHVVDLVKVKSSLFELPNTIHPFNPPQTLTPLVPAANTTEQSTLLPTASLHAGKTAGGKVDKMPDINKHHNNKVDQYSRDEVFRPKHTLSRLPVDEKPAKTASPQFAPPAKPSPSSHQATNILPHLNVGMPPVDTKRRPVSESEPTQLPEKEVAVEQQVSNEPSQNSKSSRSNSVTDDVPTRDHPVPDKKDLHGKTPEASESEGSNNANDSLDDTHMTTIIPSSREDATGLDMNAFLPVKKNPSFGKEHKKLSNDEAIAHIQKGFESMQIVLAVRHRNLEVVRAMWTGGDVMTAMNTAVRMKDQALLVDLFGVLRLKKSLWSLDLCQILLPEILDLVTSKYETYVAAACGALKLLLQTFGQVIKSNISAHPSVGVDISREERYKKCFSCHQFITQIRQIVEMKIQTPGKMGSTFRELHLLICNNFD